jgi:uncharacterized protein
MCVSEGRLIGCSGRSALRSAAEAERQPHTRNQHLLNRERRSALACLRFLGYLSAALLMRDVAAAQTPTDTATASEFLLVSGTDYALRAQGQDLAGQMYRGNQQLAPYLELFGAWAHRYLDYNTLRPQVLTMIASDFTSKELRELIAFYRTPVGVKYAREHGILATGYAKLIYEQMSLHSPELLEQIQRRSKKATGKN